MALLDLHFQVEAGLLPQSYMDYKRQSQDAFEEAESCRQNIEEAIARTGLYVVRVSDDVHAPFIVEATSAKLPDDWPVGVAPSAQGQFGEVSELTS